MSELKYSPKTLVFFSTLFRSDLIEATQVESIINEQIDIAEIFECKYFPMQKYYSKEMGSPLSRFIYCSSQPNDGQNLVPLKMWSQQKEQDFKRDGNRILNIDPGIMTLENLVLATGKPYSHRLYLGDHVYGELTYIFKDKSYQTLQWTYPDYAHEEQIQFFEKCRKLIK